MKKGKLLFVPVVLASLLAGCGEQKQESGLFTYKDGLIDFGEKFDSKYYPVVSEIEKQTYAGQITVALDFEGKHEGWEEVAKEYQRLHNNSVIVNINNNYNSETYPDAAKNMLESGKGNPTWNIVQGNLLGGLDKNAYLNKVSISGKNVYAGNVAWSKVLTSDASDANNEFIINSENLQTAWFVNTKALEKAKNKGYSVVGDNPTNWDELVSLCEAMQEAGYTYPLGLSLDTASISSSQFSWLLRVYGDFYYRNEYTKIKDGSDYGTWEVDLTDPDVELNSGFTYKIGRFFSLILDSDSANYVGATSEKFKDFIGQFKKVAKYINPNAINKKFSDVRAQFGTQSDGMNSPQIMLDYLGEGLGYRETENDSFAIDYFDNPRMVSNDYIASNTLLRDVGGNGGYLSIATHTKNIAVDEISKDFIKFFLSPYGQSIYYARLAQNNLHPQGITTVKNNLVVIPEKWSEFVGGSNTKVSFTGLSDKNDFISYLVRYMGTDGENTTQNAPSMWATLLTKGGTVDSFCGTWSNYLDEDWKSYADKKHYNRNCYLHPEASEYAENYD